MNDVARVSTIHECRHSRLADAHAAELVELVCAASDVPDETVELQMLKCLLTAVSSWTFRVRARALLRVVRACVNAYLGSASEVNQTTAKASLTQMLAVVFHRLETRSRETRDAPAPTIVVADVFSSSLARRADGEGTTVRKSGVRKSSVFGNRGLSLAALAAANAVKPTEEDAAAQMTTFVQGFINKVSADLTAVAAAAAGEDTDDLVEWTPASAAAKHREVTDLEFDNDGDATPAKERKGKESLPRAEETRDLA
jgi:brefeldin A-inhibited guanine nucleotide-exchange protein